MIEVSLALIFSAFVAGILMFLAPCTLPLVPAYLAFISGVKPDALRDPATATQARRQIVINGMFFIIGFSLVFIAFGILAGFFGSFIGQFRGVLTQVGGAFIIFFGLLMLNVFNIDALMRERRVPLPTAIKPGNPVSASIIGATFALGWTPCIGPVLASVLLLATTEGSVWSGGLLLGVFSLGLAVPFFLTAVLYGKAATTITHIQPFLRVVSVIGGSFLVFIGVLLLTNSFGLTVEYGYRVFDLFGLSGLLDYY